MNNGTAGSHVFLAQIKLPIRKGKLKVSPPPHHLKKTLIQLGKIVSNHSRLKPLLWTNINFIFVIIIFSINTLCIFIPYTVDLLSIFFTQKGKFLTDLLQVSHGSQSYACVTGNISEIVYFCFIFYSFTILAEIILHYSTASSIFCCEQECYRLRLDWALDKWQMLSINPPPFQRGKRNKGQRLMDWKRNLKLINDNNNNKMKYIYKYIQTQYRTQHPWFQTYHSQYWCSVEALRKAQT